MAVFDQHDGHLGPTIALAVVGGGEDMYHAQLLHHLSESGPEHPHLVTSDLVGDSELVALVV